MLDAAARRPLAVVCAPAGYGKTTALAQWLRYGGIDHAWLSLDVHGNDPHWFAARLLAALDWALPGRFGEARLALDGGSDLGATVIPAVVDAFAERAGERLAIVLDDYHLISHDGCHQLLCELVDTIPEGVGVVVASRTTPPLRLGRRRAAGTLEEIGPEQLAFDVEDTQRLFNESLRLDLEHDQIEQIDDRVHGWPAGLALIATALPAGNRAGFLDAVAASRESLDEYLVEEVLDNARPELRDFLCRTAILDRLSASLCEAVLGGSEAVELLAQVRRENLFVTALEPGGPWLRYHQLFADALTRELERREPAFVPELHRRACAWFEQAGMPLEAIEHAVAAGDGAHAASLLADSWPALYEGRRYVTMRRIIDRLPEERGEFGPFCAALDLLCMTGEGVDQRVTYQRAEALAARHGDDPRARLLLDILLIAPFSGNVGRSLQIGREIWTRYADEPDAQIQVAPMLGMVLWFAGEHEELRRLLEPRVRLEQPTLFKVWTLSTLALTVADEGDAELAERYAREAAAMVEAGGDQSAVGFTGVRWALAEALRVGGKLEEARHHLDRGLEAEALRPGSIGHAVSLIFDAQLALAEHDRRRAHSSAHRARQIIDQHADVGTLATRVTAVEAALHGSTHNGLLGTRPTRAELRVLELLDSELTVAEIAARLYVSRNTVNSHARRLYRRLGKSTREDVVAAARERGLLGCR